MRTRTVGVLVTLLVLGGVVAGCSQADTASTTAPDTELTDETAPPASDSEAAPAEEKAEPSSPAEESGGEASDETTPPEGDDSADDTAAPAEDLTPSEVPVWTWVLAGLVLLGAIVWMASRTGAGKDDDSG